MTRYLLPILLVTLAALTGGCGFRTLPQDIGLVSRSTPDMRECDRLAWAALRTGREWYWSRSVHTTADIIRRSACLRAAQAAYPEWTGPGRRAYIVVEPAEVADPAWKTAGHAWLLMVPGPDDPPRVWWYSPGAEKYGQQRSLPEEYAGRGGYSWRDSWGDAADIDTIRRRLYPRSHYRGEPVVYFDQDTEGLWLHWSEFRSYLGGGGGRLHLFTRQCRGVPLPAGRPQDTHDRAEPRVAPLGE